MKGRKWAARGEKKMSVVGVQRRQRKLYSMLNGAHLFWLVLDIHVPKETKPWISGRLVKLVGAIFDFWMIWSDTVSNQSMRCPETVEYVDSVRVLRQTREQP